MKETGWNIEIAALYLEQTYGVRCTSGHLEKLCRYGQGPAYSKFGGKFWLNQEDVDFWAAKEIERKPGAHGAAPKQAGAKIIAFDHVREKTPTRPRQFNFRCSDETFDAIHQIAGNANMSAADLLELLVGHAAKKPIYWVAALRDVKVSA